MFRSYCLFIILSILATAAAGTERSLTRVDLPPITPAPQKINLDGKLDPWKAVGGYSFNPLSGLIKSGGDAEIERLLSHPVSVDFKTCYDSDALYVLVVWSDARPGQNRTAAGDADHWAEGGEGFELHVRTAPCRSG